ncbi:MAG: DUF4118 domain-containing protein [bacterium]|nr:DUF4118 domain-containing protein [bacterium]
MKGEMRAKKARKAKRKESPSKAYPSYKEHSDSGQGLMLFLRNVLVCVVSLMAATFLSALFRKLGFTEANIITVYLLCVLITAMVTGRRIYSIVCAAAAVLLFNFLFTEPRFSFYAYGNGYPVTFLIMFLAGAITATLTAKMRKLASESAQTAYRAQILLDTDRILGRAKGEAEIMEEVAKQLVKLLKREVAIYRFEAGKLLPPYLCSEDKKKSGQDLSMAEENEKLVAIWAVQNRQKAGVGTEIFPAVKGSYLPIQVEDNLYGVAGICAKDKELDYFESSLVQAILGECALAIENYKNAQEKEAAYVKAKNEQLRANLLRSISHDLRTPLTSISGNASNLMTNSRNFDEETKQKIYEDIYDDALWLVNLVENLLSITRIEDGRMQLHMSEELMDDVIAEALKHTSKDRGARRIFVENSEEFLVVKMDARLIVQVIINLVDNAIKYTPEDSKIVISTKRKEGFIEVAVSDDGAGVPDENKAHVFDMFFCGSNRIADSRRSLGLGLSLCKSIITAHGGEIHVQDNQPHGAVFIFTLPVKEVQIRE